MPWKISSLTGQRLRFVMAAVKRLHPLPQLCRQFHISRKTAYKWLARFYRGGFGALRDRSRRPHRSPRRLAPRWVKAISQWRRRHRRWGGKKIWAALRRQHPRTALPSISTITRWIRRLGLTQRRRSARPGPRLPYIGLTTPQAANAVWTVDFKGWFRTLDSRRVEPLTVRDLFSRYVLVIWLLPNQSEASVRTVFVRLFRQHGLPRVMRVDNGAPFGGKGPLGLSRLTVWWLGLGIRVEFTRPARPGDNAGHEQMHGVLKAETTQPAAANPSAQQRRTTRWVRYYNQERPHEALGQKPPVDFYRKSRRRYPQRLLAWKYPQTYLLRQVRSRGSIKWQGRLRFIGRAFVGQTIGLKLSQPGIYAVYFRSHLIGEMHGADPGGLRPARYRLAKDSSQKV